MTSIRPWDQAAAAAAQNGETRRPAILALPTSGLPDIATLFSFMRDAELRFRTLRLRIEETTATARGTHVVAMDLLLRHPGDARVTTSEAGRQPAGNYELWLSDGTTVRTYSAPNKLGTRRPVRPSVRGLDDDFPGSSRVYEPLTQLPMETLPDTFVHPAGYCQNVLSTGPCWIAGTTTILGRSALLVECDHPRTIEVAADRPDFHIQVAVDRLDGVILRVVETIGGRETRRAEVVDYGPDAPLPATAFAFTFPSDTTMLF
jgi:outer membrane lipoprotein-sorting protein